MTLLFTNNAQSTLASGISNSDTSIVVATGQGTLFPSPSGGNTFRATLVRASDGAIEIVDVTARSTDTLTVTRAQEGTTGLAFVTGDRIECRITAAFLNNQNVAVQTNAASSKTTPVDADELPLADSAAAYALKKLTWANLKATMAAYYDTLTATLTNKTLTTPVINGFSGTGIGSITANSASAALTITQTGAGNAFVVEDSASVDATSFVIDTDGRVISGHTASVTVQGVTAQVQNHGTSAGQGGGTLSTSYWQNNATGSAILLNKARSATPGTFTAVQSGDGLGIIAFGGADGAAIIRAASIDAQVDGTPGTNDMPGRLVFSTTADGASTSTERYRIASDGKHTKTGYVQITDNSANAALTVTQTGSGNAFVVEDSASTDSTPFVITGGGRIIQGNTTEIPIGAISNQNLQLHGNPTLGLQNSSEVTWYSGAAISGIHSFARSKSDTIGTHAIVASGDELHTLAFWGSDGTAFLRAAHIKAEVDGTPGTNDMPGRLVFSTTADGASSPTEALRIDSKQQVGVGITPYAGVNLYIGKALTNGTNADGVAIVSQIKSDVTARATLYGTYPSTEAASFTLTNLFHYSAGSATFGAGSTVTYQYGFHAYNSLTAATNNYGFYSNIAAAANRYNFCASGTAANYFAGDVQLGKTVTAGGTTGAQTINKTVGTVNFAAAATSLVVTNSLVTANSIITATVGTNDATMKSVAVVAAAGSFTLHANAAATAETRVNFHVFN